MTWVTGFAYSQPLGLLSTAKHWPFHMASYEINRGEAQAVDMQLYGEIDFLGYVNDILMPKSYEISIRMISNLLAQAPTTALC